jgi:hypothetical protein
MYRQQGGRGRRRDIEGEYREKGKQKEAKRQGVIQCK